MKIIPSTISLHIKSNAEKKVYELFRQMDMSSSSICFHSLRLSEHQYKKMGELDFVLILERGLFVLEVKGGAVSRDYDGIWSLIDRNLVKHRRNESPFEQASSGMYSLIKSVNERFKDQPLSNLIFGYGVIFPDCEFDVPTVEWSQDIVIDKRAFKSPSLFKRSITRMVKYWEDKKRSKFALSSDEIALLAGFLRPRFDLAQSLGHRVGEIDQLMVTLTNQQLERLDAIDANQRILITGGAGTGKTFIALEVARRLVEQNHKTLLVCKSPVLSNFLRSRIGPEVEVKAFSEIGHSDLYDAIVVDEGQDVINFDDLSVLDCSLKGGLEKGVWRIFMDKNNQKGVYGRYDELAMDMLHLYSPVEASLTRNCRNTENIVVEVRLLTACDIGIATAGAGPKVKYLYASNQFNAALILEKELNTLFQNEVTLSDISLISPVSFNDSIASKLDSKYRNKIRELSSNNVREFPFNDITFSTIYNFKGLENRFIFMIDFSAKLFDNSDTASLYVAMTRARAGLTFILSDNLKPLINNILIENFSIINTYNKFI